MLSRTISGLAPSRGIWPECMVRKLRKYALSTESDESDSPQRLFATIRGHIGFQACRCDVCHRLAQALVYRGCQKGVDIPFIRTAEYDCHAGDLSALVDLVSHGCEGGWHLQEAAC